MAGVSVHVFPISGGLSVMYFLIPTSPTGGLLSQDSEDYKQDVVELVRSSGRTVTEVVRELGVSAESLRGA